MLFLVSLTLLLQTLSCHLSHSPSVHSCLRKSGCSIHLTGLPGTTFNSVLGCRYPVHFDKTNRYFKLHEKITLQREDFPGGSAGRVSACSAGDTGSSLGWEDALEEEVATHSSVLAWEIPWTEEPGRLQSTEPRRVSMTEHAPAQRGNKYSYFGQADRGNIRYVH